MTKKWEIQLLCGCKKRPRVLRWCLLLSCLLLFFSAQAQKEDYKVSISVKDSTVIAIFKQLEKQVPFRFMYYDRDIRALGKKSFSFKKTPLNVVLDSCLKGSNITYEFTGRNILFKRSYKSNLPARRKVTGVVLDENGNPLPGAAVKVVGTYMGRITNKEGFFELYVPAKGECKLEISFLGYKKRVVTVKDNKPLEIVLEEMATEVEEVVVTGYQTINKELSAASTYSVKMEDVMVPGATSVEDVLQGQIPGLSVLYNSGSPSALAKMRIRGTSTLMGNAQPLFVVDGIVQDDIMDTFNEDIMSALAGESEDLTMFGNAISGLNPMDIESITFLKDAAATAIYGTRAANGVIVITTKKGSARKTTVSYSGNIKFTERPSYRKSANMMNSKQRMAITKELFDDCMLFDVLPLDGFERTMIDYLQGKGSLEDAVEEYRFREKANTDWFDLLFDNSVSDSHSLSVSGGNQKATYYISLGLANDRGTAKGDETKRYTANLRVNMELAKWLKADVKMSYSNRRVKNFMGTTPMTYALQTSRTILPDEFYIKSEGSLSGEVDGERVNMKYPLTFNIFHELENTSKRGETKEFAGSINLDMDILKGLKGNLILAYRESRGLDISYATEKSYYMARNRGYDYGAVVNGSLETKLSKYPYGGYYNRNERENTYWEIRGTLRYNHVWKEAHAVNLMGGMQVSSRKNTGFSTQEYGYFPDRGHVFHYEYNGPNTGFLGNDYGSSTSKHKVRISEQPNNAVKLLASLVYDYKRRYVLNASFSVDGTNRFGENKRFRFSPIWSVSGRWNIVEEKWMQEQKVFSALDVKMSYGFQGNVVYGASPHLLAYYETYDAINPNTGDFKLTLKNLPSSNLDWEKTRTINVGVEFGVLKNRFTFSAEYYLKKGDKIMYDRQLPLAYGFSKTYFNDSKLENSGMEFMMRANVLKTKDWSAAISANASFVRNRVERPVYKESYYNYVNGYMVHPDYEVGAFWSWNFKGLGKDGYPVFDVGENSGYTMEELRSDPTKYMVYSGSRNPDVTGGFSVNVKWRNLTFNSNFSFAVGANTRLRAVYQSGRYVTDVPKFDANLPTEFVEHWRKAGDELLMDKPGFLRPLDKTNSSYMIPGGSVNMYDMWDQGHHRVVSADFLRCRSMSLSYKIPSDLLKKINVQTLSVGITGSNLFVVKDRRLHKQDPETGSMSVPLLPSYNISINLTL